MIPTDSEFSVLYLLYGIVLLLILAGLTRTAHKKEFRGHLIFFALYTGIMIYVFSDEENFKYGNSLAVLFYALLFPISHLVIFAIIRVIKFVHRMINKSR